MHFRYQLCGIVASAVLLLGASVASADTIIFPPAAQYNVSVGTGFCAGFNCDTPYNKGFQAHGPATLQVGCSPAAGAPNCAGSMLLAAPAPFLSVAATTSLNHTDQSSSADANVTYSYEVLCPKCAPGTLVPMSIGGVWKPITSRELVGPWHSTIWTGFL
ncbi:MAG TPA: hypothetical protein VNX60_13165 [Candidatus Acidoferrum sp.]|jgi:hypothetical protein|nr:hypothetical protein [Candidatus Acidoferrum sp.]HXA05314.1 hypothetical protein [Bryobacteraceae bacterium]